MGAYSTKSKSRKRTKVTFSYLLDTIRVNATTLFALANGKKPQKINSFEFGIKIAETLVKPFVESRSRRGLQKPVLQKIGLFMGTSEVQPNETNLRYDMNAEKRRRCDFCIKEIVGADQKKKKDKLAKITTQCQYCGICLCKKHTITACKSCAK